MSVDTSTADPLVGTVLDGRYRLDARLARGGMATVYTAFDTRLDRPVAVKVMHEWLAEDEAFVDRFRREAKAAARLSDPSVVAIYDTGEDDGRVYLVMEHVTGRTLRQVLRDRGPLPVADALAVADGVLAALQAAHAAGLVHRDVKPENVLVTDDGQVKVADFGLARAIEATDHTVADGTLLGTVAYLAPEQVVTGSADARTDVYALGIVLYEMVTGSAPFVGDVPITVAYRHVNEDVPPVPGIPRKVDEVIQAATRRDPDERYADAETMRSAVARARAALGISETSVIDLTDAPTIATRLPAVPPPPAAPKTAKAPKPQGRKRSRRGLIALAILIAILLVAGVGGWWLGSGRYSPAPRLLGLDRAAATARAKGAGFGVRVGDPVPSDTIGKDLVATQSPGGGTKARRGSAITLHLSSGPRLSTVPEILGKTEAEARAALANADLTVAEVRHRYDDTVAAGRVVAVTPGVGAHPKHGTAVTLVLSLGHAPVPVPDVRGKPRDEATTALTALGLKVTTSGKYDETVAKDTVVSESPVAGTTVAYGSTVALVVSKGPPPVVVPNVVGMRRQDAAREIRRAGLVPKFVDYPGFHGQRVYRQDPTSGSEVPKGFTVSLYMV